VDRFRRIIRGGIAALRKGRLHTYGRDREQQPCDWE